MRPTRSPRLRRFILDLAVRGKLVPQDPNDEPASELLKRIAKEKARLVKAGEIRKRQPSPIPMTSRHSILPTDWAWSRLGECCNDRIGSTPRGNKSTSRPVCSVGDRRRECQ